MIVSDKDITASVVANYFLTKSELVPMKIQKLVYYAYVWFIALNNENADDIQNVLFKEEPASSSHGPIFPSLCREFKDYDWQEVPKHEEFTFSNPKLVKFLDEIWHKFRDFPAEKLEYMSKEEISSLNDENSDDPKNSSCNKISLKNIFIFYNEF